MICRKSLTNLSHNVVHLALIEIRTHISDDRQGRQENVCVPGQNETWPSSSNSPNNDTQTKSTTVCHKQGISTTKMNG